MENNIIYETLTNIVERIKLAPENTTIEQMNDLNEVADRFKLSLYEMVIVAFIAIEDKEFNTEEIIDLIQSKIGIKSLLIKRLIRKLGKRNIIERERFSDKMSIALNETYLSAIESGDWKVVEELVPYGLYPFLRSIRHLIGGGFSYGHRMAMHFDEFSDSIDLLKTSSVSINQHLVCVKYAQKTFSQSSDQSLHISLFFNVLVKKVIYDSVVEIDEWMEYTDRGTFEMREFIDKHIKTNSWPPLKQGLVEIAGGGRMGESISIELTTRGVYELLSEFDDDKKKTLADAGFITVPHINPKDIKAQQLIFPDSLNRQFEPLKRAMDPHIQKLISEAMGGKNGVLSALFYGLPGTGKTEFCYQMAREYDLPIMNIDVAAIQSKWVGDSEKNARMVFTNYKKLCRQTKKRAILLFNEADALFSRRVDAKSSVDQMNNSLKNIFLEGIEELDGIVFATTNLTSNLDAAFERRFLFKIKFDKTDLETQSRIWKLYFPDLDSEQCLEFARKYNLSPGQITNVRKKQIIETILYPDQGLFDTVNDIASFEKLNNDDNAKVGF